MGSTNILGQRIRALREESGYTQKEISKFLNISIAALSRYETGKFEPKSTSIIVDLANFYKVSTDYLLGKSDIRNPEINFSKLDIGLSNQTYEALSAAQKRQIKQLITVIVEEGKE